MMIRVKLVIISSSDGSTVSKLIRMRICSDSDKGLPSPETWPSALLSAVNSCMASRISAICSGIDLLSS